jgi:uncharacterized protein Usg
MSELEPQLRGYRLTTAEIIYRMPDHPGLLQTYLWQKLDIAPRYPMLKNFLEFWEREIEGRIHSVRVAQRGIISAAEFRMPGFQARLH